MEKKPWAMYMVRCGPPRNPQRPYARPPDGTWGKIWSDLHGDMQRPAEMIGPPDDLLNGAALMRCLLANNWGVTKCLR